jgi:hypothetical protein
MGSQRDRIAKPLFRVESWDRYQGVVPPGTGLLAPTCQNAWYRWCEKRRLKFPFPLDLSRFETEKMSAICPTDGTPQIGRFDPNARRSQFWFRRQRDL